MSNPTRQLSGVCEISTGAFVPSSIPPAYQGEAQAIQVQVQFTDGGTDYIIPDDVTPYINLYYEVENIVTTARPMDKSGDTANTVLTEEEQVLSGVPYLNIWLIDSDENKLISFQQRIYVMRSQGKGIVVTLSPTAYGEAVAAANAAAERANTAAGAVEGITASAEDIPHGEPAAAEVQTVDGHYNIHLDIPAGAQGTPGAGFQVRGIFATLADLEAAHPIGNPGDAYAVGTVDDNIVYLWDTDTSAWKEFWKPGTGGEAFPFNGKEPGPNGYEVYGTDIPVSEDDPRNIKEALDDAGGGDVSTVYHTAPDANGDVSAPASEIPATPPGGAANSSDVQKEFDAINALSNQATKDAIRDFIFPIGRTVEFDRDVDPNVLWGGTWVRIGGFTVGYIADDTDFGTVGATGGNKTHLHGLASGYADVGIYTTGVWVNGVSRNFSANRRSGTSGSTESTSMPISTKLSGTTDSAAQLPPYTVTCKWKRTA